MRHQDDVRPRDHIARTRRDAGDRVSAVDDPRSGLAWACQVLPPSAVATMVPAAPTASHRSALRQATSYRRCPVQLFSARHGPAPGWDEPVTGVHRPALACAPAGPPLQPASNTAARAAAAAPAVPGRPPGRRRSRRASSTIRSYSRPRAGAVHAFGRDLSPKAGTRYLQARWVITSPWSARNVRVQWAMPPPARWNASSTAHAEAVRRAESNAYRAGPSVSGRECSRPKSTPNAPWIVLVRSWVRSSGRVVADSSWPTVAGVMPAWEVVAGRFRPDRTGPTA